MEKKRIWWKIRGGRTEKEARQWVEKSRENKNKRRKKNGEGMEMTESIEKKEMQIKKV